MTCFLLNAAALEDLVQRIAVAVVHELRGSATAEIVPASEPVISVGPLTIDTARHEVRLNGTLLDLKPQEFALLAIMAKRPGQVFTREQLLDLAWPSDAGLDVTDRNVDVQVCKLRRHLGRDVRIRTVPKVGYKVEDPA